MKIKNFLKKLNFNTNKDLSGKLALITGGNEGIGFQTAKNLANLNCSIIIASRNFKKSQVAVNQLINLTGNSNIYCYALDLGDFNSIDSFCLEFKKDYNKLDYLINNAGCVFYNYSATKDGLESSVQVNHLGPLKLTLKLIDLINSTPNSKVLFLSSFLHYNASLDLPFDLNTPKGSFIGREIYSKTKLMNLITSKYIQTKVSPSTKVCSIDPGFVATNFTYQNLPNSIYGWSRYLVMCLIHMLLGRTPDQGSITTVNAIIKDDIESGGYYSSCELLEPNPLVNDISLQDQLIEESLKLIK